MGSSLGMAAWVAVRDDTPIDCVVNPRQGWVELSFGPEFELTLNEKALERCVALLSRALNQVRESAAG